MKVDVKNLDAATVGQIDLVEEIFAREIRADILHRVVTWQLANRRATARAAKERGDVKLTSKKMYRQKGTGSARHGNRAAPQFRKGGKAHGPRARDFEISLNKKIRALGLKVALSAKQAEGKLIVVDSLDLAEGKTKVLAEKLSKLGISNGLFIDGEAVATSFKLAASNLPKIDVLPAIGANVYDILKHDTLVLTKAAVEKLEARFNG
ncbi:50S ribosomal protein L4 [Pedomonas sp. V897]|uniref:50S ribosomal protein L4 n=1 Tax=Pedomonas sp. V897 TaxID=3446482 RepID=UPI003EDFD117